MPPRKEMHLYFKLITVFVGAIFSTTFLTVPTYAACSKEFTFAFMEIEDAYRFGKSTTPRGRDLEIFDQVMLHAECSYTLVKLPWKRIINGIKNGRLDMTTAASFTEERAGFAHYSDPYRTEVMAMFMRYGDIDKLKVTSFADVIQSDLNLGVHLGSWYGPLYDEAMKTDPSFKSRVLQSSDFRFLHNWLTIGRVDVAIDELYSGRNYLKLAGIENIIAVHAVPANTNPVHFLFSKKTVSADDVDAINRALRAFKETDQYEELMTRFLPKKTDPGDVLGVR